MKPGNMVLKPDVRSRVQAIVSLVTGKDDFPDDEPIGGYIDSIEMMDLVAEIESMFSVDLGEWDQDRLYNVTINDIVAFIKEETGAL